MADNNFESKASTVGMIQNFYQFDSLADEDPNIHLPKFLQIYSTFKMSTIIDDAITLRLFPFILKVSTYRWLISLVPGLIKT